MYRVVAKRLLLLPSYGNNVCRRFAFPPAIINSSRFSTNANASHQSPNQHQQQQLQAENLVFAETLDSESASASVAAAEEARRHEGQSSREERRRRVEYQDDQALVLQAALRHVVSLGWTEAAMIKGAKEVGVSPSIIGAFPRKEAALVEFFMDDCLQRLIDKIDLGDELRNLMPSQRLSKLVKIRLEMQVPYISKWAQALSIQSQPMNVPISFKHRAMLVDEIWHAAGDQASDIDWYVKRTILGGIYSASEVYMLTDNSPDFHDTWTFLERRVKDVFDLEKTVLEAKYLAEAVGAGMGSSLQGFMKRVFQ